MRVAIYARVSTNNQVQAQSIEQQLSRLQNHCQLQHWTLEPQQIYRDDGFSGASLNRPGLSLLRQRAALGHFDLLLLTAPDRLARNMVQQILLVEELGEVGCEVVFLERPMADNPHDQLLLHIRGAVAEYERSLIAERLRRGRLSKLQAGQLLPWAHPPYGYRSNPARPRDPAGLIVEPREALIVQQLYEWYLAPAASIYSVSKRLTQAGYPSPRGRPRWDQSSVRDILRNSAYAGTAYGNRYRTVAAKGRTSPLQAVGPGDSFIERPMEEWVALAVPAIVSEQVFTAVADKLAAGQRTASRNNKAHSYLLRALVSCGSCRHAMKARTTTKQLSYYMCSLRIDSQRSDAERCGARYVPAGVLDELVWEDLCALVQAPEQIEAALARANSGAWLPQELQMRNDKLKAALAQLERQENRLREAYLAEIIELGEFERSRNELKGRKEGLLRQQRELQAAAEEQLNLGAIAESAAEFCRQVSTRLASASFEQRRELVELLIDRVVVHGEEVEIRYVIPTSAEGPRQRFCHLRLDYYPAH